ncbi:hypothetical protein IKE67_07715 [bacterium]|nr:hypothetical protein [bacterium]
MRKSGKIIASLILLLCFLNTGIVFAETYKGHAEKYDKTQQEQSELFTGQIEILDEKDVIKMTVSQVIDGNFSIEGDEFFAEVVSDVNGDSGVILPKGTLAHGIIKEQSEAKRLGRNGYLTLDFDYLVTPDGREIPIEGKMSTRMHPVVEAGKIVATDLGYTAAGGAVGGLMALNIFGIEAAIASNGYTVMGGAAIGGTIGLGMSLWRKGKDVLISPGDEIRVKINTKVPLPVYKDTALRQHEVNYPGLTIKITNVIHEKDPFGEANTITLTLSITNMTNLTLSGMDLALVNDYNNVFHPSIFGDTNLLFKQIKPGDRVAGRISFSVDNINRSFWLSFCDRRTKKTLSKISVDNAYKNVPEKVKKKNDKLKKKPNYYKEKDPFEV